jgi:hypothetical protein
MSTIDFKISNIEIEDVQLNFRKKGGRKSKRKFAFSFSFSNL